MSLSIGTLVTPTPAGVKLGSKLNVTQKAVSPKTIPSGATLADFDFTIDTGHMTPTEHMKPGSHMSSNGHMTPIGDMKATGHMGDGQYTSPLTMGKLQAASLQDGVNDGSATGVKGGSIKKESGMPKASLKGASLLDGKNDGDKKGLKSSNFKGPGAVGAGGLKTGTLAPSGPLKTGKLVPATLPKAKKKEGC